MHRLMAAFTMAGFLIAAPALAAPVSQPATLGHAVSGALVEIKAKPKHWRNFNSPPGWSHGRKTGWHGSNVPPGHQKKQFR